MAYKEFGATIAPANISITGFPIAMGSHIGGGRTINGKNNLKLWQLLGDGANITDQKANAIGQIWYDRSDSKYYKLTGFNDNTPQWVEYLDISNINGTTNYVTKFTGTHSIGNSLIYDNGTKVGIDTTNPIWKFVVSNGGASGLEFDPDNGSPGWNAIYSYNRSNSTYMPLRFEASKYNFSNGNVGIGTTNPGVRFVNSGASLASSPTLGSGVVGANAILSQNGLYGLYTGVSVNGDVWQQVQRNDTNTSTYRLLLNPLGGNVGVGTTAPEAKLHIYGGDLYLTNNTNTRLVIGDTISGSDYGEVSWNTAGNYLGINGSGGRPVVIQAAAGNVGIGTTNPYEKLEVVGNIETDHIKLNNSVTFLDNSAEKGGMRYNIINKTIEFFFI